MPNICIALQWMTARSVALSAMQRGQQVGKLVARW